MVVIKKKIDVFGQSGCIRTKKVVFRQSLLYSGKMVLFGQSCCIRAKVVVFGKK